LHERMLGYDPVAPDHAVVQAIGECKCPTVDELNSSSSRASVASIERDPLDADIHVHGGPLRSHLSRPLKEGILFETLLLCRCLRNSVISWCNGASFLRLLGSAK